MVDSDNPVDNPNVIDPRTVDQGVGEPGFTRYGPLLDVERFKAEYLFGVPLVSTLTGEQISDSTLKMFLRKGIAEFEHSVRIPVNPVKCIQKFDYERADDLAFGTRRLNRWPLLQVDSLKALWPGRVPGQEGVYPTSWIEPEGDTGMFRIVPRATSGGFEADLNAIVAHGFQGITVGRFKTWPNMWQVEYTAGFAHDKVPDGVNDLIGTFAAIKFLSQMGPAIFPVNSYSVGIDGMSQGSANAGPQWLQARMQDLQMQAEKMTNDLRSYYGTDIFLQAW